METLKRMEQFGHGDVHMCVDPASQLRAIIAIHDTRLGPALGGARFITYSNDEAAFMDALRLARGMTFKAALASLPFGGGKAVIVRPAGPFERDALFASFGRFVDALGGRYITAQDSGTDVKDMIAVRSATRYVAGIDLETTDAIDPSPFTALGVLRGIEACVELRLGRSDLGDLHVAVQGIGHVGYSLCRQLAASGARLTVADVCEPLTERCADELGADVVATTEVHRVECDVYAPCALGGSLNDRTVPELRCAIVAGGANNQLAARHNGVGLHERGILYAPDYAINAGGLICVAQQLVGYDAARVQARTLAIRDTVTEICGRSAWDQAPPELVADRMVHEILTRRAMDIALA